MELAKTVPMDGASISFNVVGDMDRDVVTPASFDERARVGVVQYFAFSLEVSVWRDRLVGNVEPEFAVDAWRMHILIIGVDAGFMVIK